jgi:gamma-glutamyltranspeptidase / glutathione hydrolase
MLQWLKTQSVGIVVGCLFSIPGLYASQTKLHPSAQAIASAHPLATHAGLEILRQGGNAFDAAIAVASTLAVVAPYHSGMGGGGFWLLHDEKSNKHIFLDSREVAPLKAHKDMFLDANGKPKPSASLNGGLAAAIPGEPAAFVYIAKHYGTLPLARTLARAIQLAKEGFIMDQHFHDFMRMPGRLEQIRRFPASKAIFLKNGEPIAVGERLRQPDLARTLEAIAKQGHDGFYKGRIAKQLVEGVNAAGGIWTLEDLANYKLKLREPLVSAYRDYFIVTAPPPSAGGIGLITMLNIVQRYPLDAMRTFMRVHYLVEAMRLAFWQRDQFLADPDFEHIPVNFLTSMENANALAKRIHRDKATPSNTLPSKGEPSKLGNTTHFSILDKKGNMVAATLTVNYIFGSSVVAKGTGVLLNDEMDDFSIKPGVKNVFGLVGSIANQIAPGKRPLSSMCPTFLIGTDRLAILGTPGGSRIPTMVLLASLEFFNAKGAISMVSAMRFHHQYLPDWLQFEPDTLSAFEQEKLKSMGYALMRLKQYYGDMQAISWDKDTNFVTATSDPRNIGLAETIRVNTGGYGVEH